MDRSGGRYGSMPAPVAIHGRLWENRSGQGGPVERSGVSQLDARTLQVSALPASAISLGLQLLAADCQSSRQEYLRNAVFIYISYIYLISKYIFFRSYRLTPGTMIEWGNNWARAINYRKHNNEAFAGFFSQIGRLYNVHHIWCTYKIYLLMALS